MATYAKNVRSNKNAKNKRKKKRQKKKAAVKKTVTCTPCASRVKKPQNVNMVENKHSDDMAIDMAIDMETSISMAIQLDGDLAAQNMYDDKKKLIWLRNKNRVFTEKFPIISRFIATKQFGVKAFEWYLKKRSRVGDPTNTQMIELGALYFKYYTAANMPGKFIKNLGTQDVKNAYIDATSMISKLDKFDSDDV
jgi:hypothetical protein